MLSQRASVLPNQYPFSEIVPCVMHRPIFHKQTSVKAKAKGSLKWAGCSCGSLCATVGLAQINPGPDVTTSIKYISTLSRLAKETCIGFAWCCDQTLVDVVPYLSCVLCSFMAPSVTRLLLPCSSLQVARCRWYCSLRQAFSAHKSDTCCSSSPIRPLCLSNNSCWVSMILLSSFKYSAALVGFSVGLSMSLRVPFCCALVPAVSPGGWFCAVQARFKRNDSVGCAFYASPLF